MARDRQRSKQRRNRQPGAGGPAADPASSRTRDDGLEPTDADLTENGTPAPDIAEHDTAHDEAQVALGRTAHAERAHRGRLLTFLRHVVDELRRVQWPDRRQVGQGTIVTLGFVVVAGGYLGLLDAIWKPLVEAIL